MKQSASPTAFQQRVYAATRRVPKGQVTTYKLLGRYIGCRCYRAIGQALRRNPFAPEVPCHRVVASDRSLGGFAGQKEGAELDRKRRLLEEEGVPFDENGRIAGDAVFDFTVPESQTPRTPSRAEIQGSSCTGRKSASGTPSEDGSSWISVNLRVK